MSMTAIALQAQSAHPTIKSFTLKFEDGDPGSVSKTMDSLVIVTYIIKLKDTLNLNKIYARISSGQTTKGNLLLVNYMFNGAPVLDNGAYVFKRNKDIIYIKTITTTQKAENNYEVFTEDNSGKLSPCLNWKNQ